MDAKDFYSGGCEERQEQGLGIRMANTSVSDTDRCVHACVMDIVQNENTVHEFKILKRFCTSGIFHIKQYMA
jgi:hypothetical protein